nr:pantoate--beta-alanine ligase [Desulforhopalus singaporensis]
MESITEMQQYADQLRADSKKIGFVPTMGYLHQGHLSLVDIAGENCDTVVLSIFVNPAQFGPNEDLDSYPRNEGKDIELAREKGVDVVFLPSADTIYPDGYQSYVELAHLPNHLCGLSRPVFFKGITTVVTQLFHIVKPHVAVFGEKDFQQLATIRRMVKDLKFDIEVMGGPIVREPDGLAMSSRNAYLKDHQRKAALSLSRSIQHARQMVADGTTDATSIIQQVTAILSEFAENTIDYVSICDTETMDPVSSIEDSALLAIAVNLNKIRLIDNTVLNRQG